LSASLRAGLFRAYIMGGALIAASLIWLVLETIHADPGGHLVRLFL
jgi:hypothetical protein